MGGAVTSWTNLKTIEHAEPRQTKITARLNAQGAMLEELLIVTSAIEFDSTREAAKKAVLEDNVLHRPSLGSRVDVFEKLSVRYFRADAPRAVSRLIHAVQTASDRLHAGLFAYTMLLWNDALVFLLGCEWLAPRLGGPPFVVETSDIEAELERLSHKKAPEIRKWRPGTRRRVATHYLGLLRDCGFANGKVRKTLRRPYIPPEVVLFGVQLILGGGESADGVLKHPLFRAMGLSVEDVIAALTALHQEGRVEFAVQGGIVHLKIQDARERLQ